MFSSCDFYKHVLLTLTLFILLENVGKIGQDLSVGPDSRGGTLSGVYLWAVSISL